MRDLCIGIALATAFWMVILGIHEVNVSRRINKEFEWCRDVKAEYVRAWVRQNRRR